MSDARVIWKEKLDDLTIRPQVNSKGIAKEPYRPSLVPYHDDSRLFRDIEARSSAVQKKQKWSKD